MARLRLFAVLLFFCLFVENSFGDINKVGNRNVGAAAGFVTGYGLSYRQWIGTWGVQLTTAPFHQKQEDWSSTRVSIGITALKKIKEAKLVNLFAYLGPHYHFYRTTDTYYAYPNYEPYAPVTDPQKRTSTYLSRILFLGGGPGIDFHFLRISFSLMFGISGQFNFDANETALHLTGESALYYSF